MILVGGSGHAKCFQLEPIPNSKQLETLPVTAYSEVEGVVRVSLTVSIHVQMTVLLFFAVNKSVVDWLPSNYGLNQPMPRA